MLVIAAYMNPITNPISFPMQTAPPQGERVIQGQAVQMPLTQIITRTLHKHNADTISYCQSWMPDSETPVLDVN